MLYKLFTVLLIYLIKISALNIGDFCRLPNGQQGICRKFGECNDLMNDMCADHVVCGTNNNDFWPIICCKDGAKSKQKCHEYAKITKDLIRRNPQMCKAHRPLIYGGVPVEPLEFPHQALLGYVPSDGKILWQCGGTLISEYFVLTAAHCLVDEKKNRTPVSVVRLGEFDVSREDDIAKPEDFKVTDMFTHPERRLPLKYHDIALLKLDRRVIFNEYMRPACLHTTVNIPLSHGIQNVKYLATGWGLTNESLPSPVLQKVVLDHFDNGECSLSYRHMSQRFLSNGVNDNIQLCAGGRTHNKDTCPGDSGGPLQIYNREFNCMYDIVGVTSFGKICGIVKNPAIYVRVSAYVDWIEKIVWP